VNDRRTRSFWIATAANFAGRICGEDGRVAGETSQGIARFHVGKKALIFGSTLQTNRFSLRIAQLDLAMNLRNEVADADPLNVLVPHFVQSGLKLVPDELEISFHGPDQTEYKFR